MGNSYGQVSFVNINADTGHLGVWPFHKVGVHVWTVCKTTWFGQILFTKHEAIQAGLPALLVHTTSSQIRLIYEYKYVSSNTICTCFL